MRLLRHVAFVRDHDVRHVRGLAVARRARFGFGFAIASLIAALGIGGFHGGHHVIRKGAPGTREGERGIVDDLIAEERVALDLEVVVADVAGHEQRRRRVARAVESCAAALHVEDAELPPLDVGIHVQQLDNFRRVGALLELFEHGHLIAARVVGGRLAGGDADAGHDDRLNVHQIA